jgi:cyclohexanone monooxygenase
MIINYSIKFHFGHQVLAANYDTQQKCWQLKIENCSSKMKFGKLDLLLVVLVIIIMTKVIFLNFQNNKISGALSIHNSGLKIDYTGKKVIVIGSGATAITLVPALVKGGAKHVTMLQRSPTILLQCLCIRFCYQYLRQHLPVRWAYR